MSFRKVRRPSPFSTAVKASHRRAVLDQAIDGRGFTFEGLEERIVLSALPLQAELQAKLKDISGEVQNVINAVDTFHDKIFDNVLTQKLPFLSDALKGPKDTSDDVLNTLKDKVNAAFTTISNTAGAIDSTTVENALNGALSSIFPSGFTPVVEVVDGDSNGTADTITVGLHLHDTLINSTFKPGFNLGIDGLGLKVTGSVNVQLSYDFNFKFGASVANGFFVDLSPTGNDPEFKLNLKVTTPGLAAQGQLAFLQLDVNDDPANPTKFEAAFLVDLTDGPDAGSLLSPAEIPQVGLSANLTGNADLNFKGRVSFAGNATFPSLVTDLNIDWGFNTAGVTAGGGLGSFGSEPTIAFNNVGLDIGSFFSNFVSPVVEKVRDVLKPVQPVIDVLTTRMPVFSDVGFLRDIYDAAPSGNGDGQVTLLELIKKLSDNPALKFIDTVIQINDLVNKIPSGFGPNTIVSLGSFSVNDNAGPDVRSLANFANVNLATFTAKNLQDELGGLFGDAGAKVGDFLSKISADAFKELPSSRGLEFPILDKPATAMKLLLGQDVDLFTFDAPRLGFDFHFDEFFRILGPFGVRLKGDFSAGAKFAFGYDTNGIRQFVDGGLSNPLLIFDGFYVSDTDQPNGSGTNDVAEVTLSASIQAFAGVDVVVAAAGVGGGIFADVSLNLHDPDATASSFGDGKLRVSEIIERFEHGPFCLFDMKGKLTAGLSAYVRIGIDVPFVGFVGWEDTFDIAKATLLDFTFGCLPDPSEPDPILGTVLADGTLRLNMGPNAAARVHRDTTDDGESFVVKHVSGDAGNETVTITAFGFTQTYNNVKRIYGEGGVGDDVIDLQAGVLSASELWGDFKDPSKTDAGNDQLSGGEGRNLIHGNGGNDELTARTAGSELYGDDGDDTMFGALGNDTVRGGRGKDKLNGAGGDDDLDGGDDNDILDGGSGKDTLTGAGGDDQLRGRDGNDNLNGGTGNDVLVGGLDADSLVGGDGVDYLLGDDGEITFTVDPATKLPTNTSVSLATGGGNDTLRGDAGKDALYGQDGDDDLAGGSEDDYLEAGAGADKGAGDAGNDSILGGIGNDSLSGGLGNDTIQGEDGNDSIAGNEGTDSLLGGNNDDVISGGADGDRIEGNAGNDTVTGDAGNDDIAGGTGADLLSGNDDNDTIHGDAGNDTVNGNAGNDSLFGDANDDVMSGGTGLDVMSGGADADTMNGDDDADQMSGGAGNDTMNGNGGADVMFGDADNDVMSGNEDGDTMSGGTGNDSMFGNDGNDLMTGDDGDDDMLGNAGGDTIGGGAGQDAILGDDGAITATSALIPGTTSVSRTLAPSSLTFGGDDSISGGDGQDVIYAQGGNDTVSGGLGDDTVQGNAGSDSITGDGGDDDLIGGSSVAGTPDGADTIDGGAGHDVIVGDNGSIARTILAGNVWDRYVAGATPGTGKGAENNAPIRTVALLDLDTIGGGDNLAGGVGDDTMMGGFGDDVMSGNDGNDDMIGHLGADLMNGGAGSDAVVGDKGVIVTDLLDGSTAEEISSQGKHASATIDELGTLKRYVTLVDPAAGGNDTLGGGDGDDFLHGGAGLDVIAGDAGDDAAFGDAGNDLMTGGTGADHLYGGGGNDNMDGNAGADILYGGDGDDRLVADQDGDRLVDWFGNFNDFVVPGPSYGGKVIVRSPAPAMIDFLLDLAAGDGATDANGEIFVVTPPSPSNSGPGGRTGK